MILEILKDETAAIHKKVEQDNLAKYIMDGSIDQRRYEILLRQNFLVYKAVEDFINAAYDILPDNLKAITGYQKTNALVKDLTHLSDLKLPQSLTITANRDLATVLGKMYVIEGSMMGGMMMSRKLDSCSNLSHINTHHFYAKDIKEVSIRWKSFKTAVSQIKLSTEEMNVAVNSAKDTFRLFQTAYKIQMT